MALADLLTPRVCELGKIKIGGLGASRQSQSGGTWRAPRKDDHFTVTTLVRNTAGDLLPDDTLMKSLLVKHGDQDGKLRRLPIYLLSNDVEDAMQSAFVYYQGKQCIARADGEKIEWFFDRKTRQPVEVPIVEEFSPEIVERVDQKGNKLFKLHTTFNCVIGAGEGRWGGVYKFRTTSRITADQLYGSLLHIQRLTNGQLAGIPLMLCVRPMQVSPQGKTTTVHVVHCEILGADMLQIQQRAKEAARMRFQNAAQIRQIETQHRKLLALPGGESPEDVSEIVAEFAPEQAAGSESPAFTPDPLLESAPPHTPPRDADATDAPGNTTTPPAPASEPEPSRPDDGAGEDQQEEPIGMDDVTQVLRPAPVTDLEIGTPEAFREAMEAHAAGVMEPAAFSDLMKKLAPAGHKINAPKQSDAAAARRAVLAAFRAGKLGADGKIVA